MSGVSSTSATTTTGSKLVVNGLVSGITTPAVVNALLEGYQQPITNFESQQTTLGGEASDFRTLATALQAVQSAAEGLSTTSGWDFASPTTSDSSVATAVAADGAQTGSLTFEVTQLAQANVLASSGSVASEAEAVTSASSILVSTGAAGVGLGALTVTAATGSSSLPLGSFSLTVTRSSAAAVLTGASAPGALHVTPTSTPALTLTVSGTAYHLRLSSGTYDTASALAGALSSAASAAGAPIQVKVGATGDLKLSTDTQGATASIRVTGGTTLGALGLAEDQAASGIDAVVTVGGTSSTVSSITAGDVLSLVGPGGATILATVASSAGPSGALLRAGSASVANVATGNGSLSDVVSAINSSGLAATATAVQISSGAYILQVSADDTGTSGAVSVGAGAFGGSALSQLRTITAAQEATVSVGGSGGYTLSSSTDTFTNLLPGTSVTVASTGPVTVTVSRDATGAASRVASLVTAANAALADVQTYAGYTTKTKTGGPLMGNAVVTGIKDEVLSLFASGSGTSSLGDLANAGVTLSATGSLSFTKEAFVTAFDANPTQVADLFVQGGTAGSPDVTFGFASTATAPGSYGVLVTQSASQAVDEGRLLTSGSVSTAEALTVTMGTAAATYTTTVGESLTSIASGLNTAFAASNLDLSAEAQTVATGTRLEVVSAAYGTAASFSVTSAPVGTVSGTGTTGLGTTAPATFTGTNVKGKIGGVTAVGSGQVLTVPSGASGGGLGVVVTATGITATGTPVTLGTFEYRPGVAQRLATAMSSATNASTGSITTTIKSLTDEATGLNSQISMYERLEAEQRTTLEKEFATMETNLGKLKDESSELTSELSKLTGTSSKSSG